MTADRASRGRAFGLLIASAVIGGGACGDADRSNGPDGGVQSDTGTVVVGVTTGLRVGTDFDRLRVVLRAGGAPIRDETLPRTGEALALPLELSFAGRPSGELVYVELTATSSAVSGLHVTRKASTRVVGGRSLLLRVSLDAACVAVDAPGGVQPPTCEALQTCAAGACVGVAVDPSALEPYTPTWAKGGVADRCRPAAGGPPEVVLGQGQADFLPLDDCSAGSPEPAQLEAGPQGGHHIWLAVRMKNLHQSGSITTVRGHFHDHPKDPWDMAVIFTFEPDEGGYCKLYGIRYQLDTNGIAIAEVAGKRIDLAVEVKDADGTIGVGKRCVVLSDTIL